MVVHVTHIFLMAENVMQAVFNHETMAQTNRVGR